jgi:hypothetical protein
LFDSRGGVTSGSLSTSNGGSMDANFATGNWIDFTSINPSFDDAFVTWALFCVSGVGVAENYNCSEATDFGFFLNQGVPPFAADVAFQMELSGHSRPSIWAMMLLGLRVS